jgi:UDP-N-acetyl-D-mannosaminuronic acid transferase (WecB/TagA/CpsF family)
VKLTSSTGLLDESAHQVHVLDVSVDGHNRHHHIENFSDFIHGKQRHNIVVVNATVHDRERHNRHVGICRKSCWRSSFAR